MPVDYTYAKDTVAPASLRSELPEISPVCLDILYRRGIRTKQEISDFLMPDASILTKQYNFQDADKACARIKTAIEQKEEMVVYQDYDVDGVCAGAIMVEVITALGGKITPYANARSTGYGICSYGLEEIKKLYPQAALVITVDNGIVAHEAIRQAMDMGYEVIVTDHHEPGEMLPDCTAVVDAKRKDETYPYRQFCGAGLAFKLMLLLCGMMHKPLEIALKTIDLAALATVADIVPLTGENRVLVKEGMRVIEKADRPFFSEIRRLTNTKQVSAHQTIGYTYAPMINALSRMHRSALIATNALLCTDPAQVSEAVVEMKEVNEERREKTKEATLLCMSLLENEPITSAVVIQHEDIDEGIVGIVAGKLKDEYNRPTIVFSLDENGDLRGSCRSIPAVPIKEALDTLAKQGLILTHGGHQLAAGVTIRKEDFDRFKSAFIDLSAEMMKDKNLEESRVIDYVFDGKDLTVETIQELRMLEPFGEGNPLPRYGLRTTVDEVSFVGQDQCHVKYMDRTNGITIIHWHGGEAARQNGSKKKTKFVGYPELNYFRDQVSVQFIDEDR